MYISPPIAVLAIASLGLAATAWLAPPREPARMTVSLPASTYQALALWGHEQGALDGSALSVEQAINKLSRERLEETQ